MSWSILSDWASVPTRGSRLVGLLSMIITSVLGSACLAQPDKQRRMPANKNPIHREHRGARRKVILSMQRFCVPLCPLWLNIRNFSQHHSILRARGRRHIPRLPMPGLISQKGEGYSFFRLAGHTVIVCVAEPQAQPGDLGRQHLDQRLILRSAAGNNELPVLSAGRNKPLNSVRDGSCRERRSGGNNVWLGGSAALVEKVLSVFPSKLF